MRNPSGRKRRRFGSCSSLVYFGLIVVAAAIAAWLGLVVFLVLTAIAVWLIRGGRREPPRRVHVERGGAEGERRILVVANETVGGEELRELLRAAERRRPRGGPGRLPGAQLAASHWASDEDPRPRRRRRGGSTRASPSSPTTASRRAARSVTPIRSRRSRTRSYVRRRRDRHLDAPAGRSHWLEQGVVEGARARFDVPVSTSSSTSRRSVGRRSPYGLVGAGSARPHLPPATLGDVLRDRRDLSRRAADP